MTRLIVLGDLNLDVRASLPEGLPFGGEVRTPIQAVPGGSAANVARAARGEGAEVLFVGCTGKDLIGDLLVLSLAAAGIETRVRRVDAPSGTVLALWKSTERTMFCSRGANDALDAAWVEEADFCGADHLHVSGYALLAPSQRAAADRAVELARQNGLTVSLNLPPANLLADYGLDAFRAQLAAIDWVFLNLEEGTALTEERDPKRMVDALADRFEAGALTLGKKGALAWRGTERAWAGARPIEIADSTGAGDAFAGGFLVTFLNTKDLERAVHRGVEVARQVLAGVRPASPSGSAPTQDPEPRPES